MFAPIFESESPLYALPGEADILPEIFGGITYNEYLITPPRIYAEELAQLLGVWVNRERTPWSDFTIHLHATTSQIYYPSYNYVHWRFDGMTGAYLGRTVGLHGSLYDYQIHQTRDGSLWRVAITGEIFEIDTVTFEEIDDTRQAASHYGAIVIYIPLIDRALNLAILKTNNELNAHIGVYNFTTGALVRRIAVSGDVAAIMAEDNRRCYVLTTTNLLNLVDYTTGEILSTLRAPVLEDGALGSLLTWDRYLRRLLRFTWRPNDTDGACLSTVEGYYPVPLPVGMTAPIPLKAPRKGRRIPCLARVYGDAGEGIPGVQVTPEVSEALQLSGAPPATDHNGKAVFDVTCLTSGAATIDLTATV